ncbi:hypothetical protein [Cyanobium sp. Morenito 9A2]|uniref:hypothetical protein n=1 Tax=Cyanobium sp. Morenito 9A2 TaxID=2823718 RepID=UPI0020CFB13A|nr:hypothetical protein [Cyanobium sp. Morenito 9A2]MCP9850329.1 hypothetical protein [Cyanobium sp. Morenito 9A2]
MEKTSGLAALSPRKWAELALVWLAALGLSSLLVWAGQHWPERLPIEPVPVAALVLVPPALIALVLVLRWPSPSPVALPTAGTGGDGGESTHGVEEQG